MPFVTSLGMGAHLEAWGVPARRIVELDWWESYLLPGAELRVHAAPSQHFSGRRLNTRNSTLWSSLVVETPRHRVFFSGDTGLTPQYAEIAARLGPFDLVMLEVGAFLPVHWGTFALALHDWDAPAEALFARAPREQRLLMPRLGEAVEPARELPLCAWWRDVEQRPAPAHAPPQAGSLAWPPD